MTAHGSADVMHALADLLGAPAPENAASDIDAALELATLLESKGFVFRLQDACPKSLTQSLWKARFAMGDNKGEAVHENAAMAVCLAAIDALQARA